MLMGEFDFTTNFIKDTETPSLAKVIFIVDIIIIIIIKIATIIMSQKGVLPDLHLVHGACVHEPLAWAGRL